MFDKYTSVTKPAFSQQGNAVIVDEIFAKKEPLERREPSEYTRQAPSPFISYAIAALAVSSAGSAYVKLTDQQRIPSIHVIRSHVGAHNGTVIGDHKLHFATMLEHQHGFQILHHIVL